MMGMEGKQAMVRVMDMVMVLTNLEDLVMVMVLTDQEDLDHTMFLPDLR